MDYGAKATACVDAFMEAIQWDSAMKQFDRVSRESSARSSVAQTEHHRSNGSKCSAAARNSAITGS
jgi:hypothetical protein